jgi:lipopolysaccharide export LptBFGC system permease protein LptF
MNEIDITTFRIVMAGGLLLIVLATWVGDWIANRAERQRKEREQRAASFREFELRRVFLRSRQR